jgi:hypothetical protein
MITKSDEEDAPPDDIPHPQNHEPEDSLFAELED